MARVAIIGVVLVALMVMAEAKIFDDSFEELDEELDNQYSGGRQCHQELSDQRLQSCQQYLQRGGRGRGMGEVILRRGGYEEDQFLEQCCRELRRVNERCRCQAIEHALERAQGQRGGRSHEYGRQQDWDSDEYERPGRSQDYNDLARRGDRGQQQDLFQRAQNLPQQCRLNRPQFCQIRGRRSLV